jgi:hypothetical protein
MSHGYADIRRTSKPLPNQSQFTESEVEMQDEHHEPVKHKRPKGTSDFPQVKMPRATYDALKVVASLTGKTVPEMLERFVSEGIDAFRSLTVDQLLSK